MTKHLECIPSGVIDLPWTSRSFTVNMAYFFMARKQNKTKQKHFVLWQCFAIRFPSVPTLHKIERDVNKLEDSTKRCFVFLKGPSSGSPPLPLNCSCLFQFHRQTHELAWITCSCGWVTALSTLPVFTHWILLTTRKECSLNGFHLKMKTLKHEGWRSLSHITQLECGGRSPGQQWPVVLPYPCTLPRGVCGEIPDNSSP